MTGAIDWRRIDTVVFDVDGTLYDQARLRLHMSWLLLRDDLARPDGWHRLKTIRAVRSYREEMAAREERDIATRQYDVPAARLGLAPDFVRAVAGEWLEVRPLAVLARYIRPGTTELFRALSASGRRVCVFSDHPVTAKLAALGLTADLSVCASDPHIDRFKPNPAGLHWILQKTGASPDACLMIGDRIDRDGEAARRAGMRFLLVGRARGDVARCTDFNDPMFAPLLSNHRYGEGAAMRLATLSKAS